MTSKYKIITSSMFKSDLKDVIEYIGHTLLNLTATDSLLIEHSLKENILRITPIVFPPYISESKKKFMYHKINIKTSQPFIPYMVTMLRLRDFYIVKEILKNKKINSIFNSKFKYFQYDLFSNKSIIPIIFCIRLEELMWNS